jgi:ABC-type nitrate/sulfonate/bicarbonate transport system substrate-binding protein
MRFFLSLSGRDIVEKKPELAKRFIKALVEGIHIYYRSSA